MEKMRMNAAGIDIGSRQVFVSIEGEPVKSFETFTSDLESLGRYLSGNKITTVAMEATGSYWYVLYDILLEAGLVYGWWMAGKPDRYPVGKQMSKIASGYSNCIVTVY